MWGGLLRGALCSTLGGLHFHAVTPPAEASSLLSDERKLHINRFTEKLHLLNMSSS